MPILRAASVRLEPDASERLARAMRSLLTPSEHPAEQAISEPFRVRNG